MSNGPFPLQPVRAQARDDAVLAALADLAMHEALRAGDRLPPERELAERLGVSRATVREALQRWEGLGLVERRQGSGTYLKIAITPDSVYLPLTIPAASEIEGLLHTLEIRRALEAEAAALCARRASPAAVAGIVAKLDRMEDLHRRYGDAPEADWEFHLAIYRATANPLMEQFVASMRDALHRFWENPLDLAGFARSSFPYHRTMTERIVAGDPHGARAEALKLIDSVEQDIRAAAPQSGPQA